MRVPIIGILASVSAALGLYSLWWYHRLSRVEQEEADRLACRFAGELFNKGLHELTRDEMKWVHELVKGHVAA